VENVVRRLKVAVLASGLVVSLAVPAQAGLAAPVRSGPQTRLLVTLDPRAHAAVERQVHAVGGSVTRDLPLVSAVAVSVPAAAVATIAAVPGVRSATPDAAVQVLGTTASDGGPSVYRQVVGSDAAERAGLDGSGVGIALVDTGIADVPDLAGQVQPVTDDTGVQRPCVNLSGEATCQDSYGHGTFIAGLIAGNGASSGGAVRGVAPGAHLVSVKVAGRDGSSDVSTILAAIQWVVSFRDRYGIRVLNLSLGTDSTQSYTTDPLNFAVERAWAAGITVVVAAGNLGPAAHTVTKPADDPFVISVGADDDRGTPGLGDDMVPDFSGRGPTAADGLAKPDVLAPGAGVLSVRAPGSDIDTAFPPAQPGPYRRGSGTSMAAGVTSGAVALMTQADPAIVPDRAKYALLATARGAATDDPYAAGAGVIDAYRAATQAPPGLANQGVQPSNGLGSLDLSRGSMRVASTGLLPTVVGGLTTAQLLLWVPTVFTATVWSSTSWYLSPFATASWAGTIWPQGKNWQGKNWQGASFYGVHDDSVSYGAAGRGSASYGAWR
jgi:serine protease AprX